MSHVPQHVLDHPDLHEAVWAAATSFRRVAQLTGSWARGEIARLPGGGAAPERVLAVSAQVTGLAEWGMAVLDAQDGADEGYRELRAYVSIVVVQDDALLLARACEDAGMLVLRSGIRAAPPLSVAVTRWHGDDDTAAHAYPETELIGHLARGVDPRAAAEIGLRTSHLLVVDPMWGRSGDLWATMATFCATHVPSSPAAGADPFSVAFRVDQACRPVVQAIDIWVSELLAEVREQVRPHREGAAPCLTVLPADVGSGNEVAPGAPLLLLAGQKPLPMHDQATALHLLWAELNRALRVITGDPGPFSLVIDADAMAVVGWQPLWCPEHGTDEPVAWWQAGVGVADPEAAGVDAGTHLGALPSGDLGLAPDAVARIPYVLRKWGAGPPTTSAQC